MEKSKWSSEKSIHNITNSDNLLNFRKCLCKKPQGDTFICRFLLGSIHRGKIEQILLAYGLPKETIVPIMMLYENTKVKVCSSDGDIDFFDIVAGVLQGNTLAPYLFIICLDYVLQMSIDLMKESGFTLEKARTRKYPAQTITDTDYVDDIALLANTHPKLNPCCIV